MLCNFTALPLLPAKDTCPGGGADTGLKPVFKANRSHIHSNTPELFPNVCALQPENNVENVPSASCSKTEASGDQQCSSFSRQYIAFQLHLGMHD
jgi:hypothetical protein